MAAWRIPDDDSIRDILRQRIDDERAGVGIVVGAIDAGGRRIVAHGASGRGDGLALDGDTLFEIGSITKPITALLLAEAVRRGEMALDDPAAKFLPPGVSAPERGGRQITLIDLATHTSGLPRWPDDITPAEPSSMNWTNPYAAYTLDELYRFLGRYRLRWDIGATHAYSNVGFGLLGHVLALNAGLPFEDLVRERITGPLGMADTAIQLSPEQEARFAVGHDHERQPVPHWQMPTFAGAGALRSTAGDLLTFLAAELGYIETPLAAAMAAQTGPRRPGGANFVQSLRWRIGEDDPGEVVWHGGAIGGFRCFALFNRARGTGGVMLSNSVALRNDDIPFHLLSGAPLKAAPEERAAVPVAAEVLETYVGRYQFRDRRRLDVTREEGRLFAQLIGQRRFEVFAEGPAAFFWRIVEARMVFEVGAGGAVTGLVLSQNGRDMAAARVGSAFEPEAGR